MPDPDASFGWKDALLIALILVFGALGYLCDIHSSLALPALPCFGAFFLFSLLALVGMCAIQVVRKSNTALLIGLALSVTFICLALWLVVAASGM